MNTNHDGVGRVLHHAEMEIASSSQLLRTGTRLEEMVLHLHIPCFKAAPLVLLMVGMGVLVDWAPGLVPLPITKVVRRCVKTHSCRPLGCHSAIHPTQMYVNRDKVSTFHVLRAWHLLEVLVVMVVMVIVVELLVRNPSLAPRWHQTTAAGGWAAGLAPVKVCPLLCFPKLCLGLCL